MVRRLNGRQLTFNANAVFGVSRVVVTTGFVHKLCGVGRVKGTTRRPQIIEIIADYFFATLRKGPNRKLKSRFPLLPLNETVAPTRSLVKIMS